MAGDQVAPGPGTHPTGAVAFVHLVTADVAPVHRADRADPVTLQNAYMKRCPNQPGFQLKGVRDIMRHGIRFGLPRIQGR